MKSRRLIFYWIRNRNVYRKQICWRQAESKSTTGAKSKECFRKMIFSSNMKTIGSYIVITIANAVHPDINTLGGSSQGKNQQTCLC